MPTNSHTSLKTIVDFARRKGFVFPSSEIYGGFAATYDFGPLGKLLKDNLVNAWRDFMINYRTDTVEIEGAIFLHPKVWEASGHIGGFSDLLTEDLVTKKRYRADHLVEEAKIPVLNLHYAGTFTTLISDEKSKDGNFEEESKIVKVRDENLENISVNQDVLENQYFSVERRQKMEDLVILTLWKNKKIDCSSLCNKFLARFFNRESDLLITDILKDGICSIVIKPMEDSERIILQNDILTLHPNNPKIDDAGSLTAEEIDQIIEFFEIKSPDGNPLSKARKFNLLVKTHLGSLEDETSLAYLKGEACANTYVDWKAVQETTRRKIPFGIGQLGKAFRNEITVKQFMFRTREFEQIDMEFFVKPPEFIKKDENGKNLEKDHFEWFAYWKEERYNFYTQFLGYNPDNLKWHQHSPEELVFYAAEAWDIYYNFGQMGYKEMEGVHNRTDYDTRQHQKFSGTDLTYLDPETNQRYLPYIVETSLGVNRLFLSTLFEFYCEEEIHSDESAKAKQQILELEQILEGLKS